MPLKPENSIHAEQIIAGIQGRKVGHAFESQLADKINSMNLQDIINRNIINKNVFTGDPAKLLLNYIIKKYNIKKLNNFKAISTGDLATSETGKKILEINGVYFNKCKSDLILSINNQILGELIFGVSIKQCNNIIPTNAQLYFTTASAFHKLLNDNNIYLSNTSKIALMQFCGDKDYRPCDVMENKNRAIDPRRYFWEEINSHGRIELEECFSKYQKEISKLLFQKAYLNDQFVPDLLLHKTKKAENWDATEVAIFTIDELIEKSYNYKRFELKEYSVLKGRYKDPPNYFKHLAPRFGIIQMQRGGQAQHPTQLQFNLEAGYFYHI